MTVEGGIFLFLGLLFILPALYWLSRLVNWVAGRKLIPLWLLAALTVAAIVGGSLYLDAAGIITPVKVVDKSDTISLGRNGSWRRNLSVQVEYQLCGDRVETPHEENKRESSDAVNAPAPNWSGVICPLQAFSFIVHNFNV